MCRRRSERGHDIARPWSSDHAASRGLVLCARRLRPGNRRSNLPPSAESIHAPPNPARPIVDRLARRTPVAAAISAYREPLCPNRWSGFFSHNGGLSGRQRSTPWRGVEMAKVRLKRLKPHAPSRGPTPRTLRPASPASLTNPDSNAKPLLCPRRLRWHAVSRSLPDHLLAGSCRRASTALVSSLLTISTRSKRFHGVAPTAPIAHEQPSPADERDACFAAQAAISRARVRQLLSDNTGSGALRAGRSR
jgi:hypothetical protein